MGLSGPPFSSAVYCNGVVISLYGYSTVTGNKICKMSTAAHDINNSEQESNPVIAVEIDVYKPWVRFYLWKSVMVPSDTLL